MGMGKIFRVTLWGESHGKSIGAVIEGCPSRIAISKEEIQKDLDKRRPGQNELVSKRNERDKLEILSGIKNGMTTGTPISLIIHNNDIISKDYDQLEKIYRPGHADITYQLKYGIREHRGGGFSSARITAPLVAAGSIARKIVIGQGIKIQAYVKSVGDIKCDPKSVDYRNSPVRCPDPIVSKKIIELINDAKDRKDSLGGIIECHVTGMLSGLGEPFFDKLDADIAKGMMCLNGSKGFEFGSGFRSAAMFGSQNNDEIIDINGMTETNNSGGVLGGISNGMPLIFRVAFKPASTIGIEQKTVDAEGNDVRFAGKGRHDPCYVPRAVPIVEAMTAIILSDHLLRTGKWS